MDETPISVTLAARKFSDYINRVRYQGASFLLEKNGVPVARLIPVQSKLGSDIEQLATTPREAREVSVPSSEKEESTVAPPGPEQQSTQNHEPAKVSMRPSLNR